MGYVLAILCVAAFGLLVRHYIRKSRDEHLPGVPSDKGPKFPPEDRL